MGEVGRWIFIYIFILRGCRESGPKKRERDAWKIYRTYIAIGAPHELNLDILSRKVIFDALCPAELWIQVH